MQIFSFFLNKTLLKKCVLLCATIVYIWGKKYFKKGKEIITPLSYFVFNDFITLLNICS